MFPVKIGEISRHRMDISALNWVFMYANGDGLCGCDQALAVLKPPGGNKMNSHYDGPINRSWP